MASFCIIYNDGLKPFVKESIMQRGVFMSAVIMIVLSFFAVYGMLQMIAKTCFKARREKSGAFFIHRVVGVLNSQETVEGMIRSLAWEDIREEVIAVDMGSEDDTLKILERLEKEYDFLHVMSIEEYREYLHRAAINVKN